MKMKKVLKVVLIVLLSLILVLVLSLAAIFQFVIKPHTSEITTAIEQVINDPEIIGEPESKTLPEEILEENNLSDFLAEEIPEKPTTDNPATQKQPKKPIEEYDNIYDYAKDNVEPKDLKTGMAFASRVDISYILRLLKGGLTIPEKVELYAYLKQYFSSSEMKEGIAIYNKYEHLLK